VSEPCRAGQGPCRTGGLERCAGVRSPNMQCSREAGVAAVTAYHTYTPLSRSGWARPERANLDPLRRGPHLAANRCVPLGPEGLGIPAEASASLEEAAPLSTKNSVRCPGRCRTLRQGQTGQPYTAQRGAATSSLLCCSGATRLVCHLCTQANATRATRLRQYQNNLQGPRLGVSEVAGRRRCRTQNEEGCWCEHPGLTQEGPGSHGHAAGEGGAIQESERR